MNTRRHLIMVLVLLAGTIGARSQANDGNSSWVGQPIMPVKAPKDFHFGDRGIAKPLFFIGWTPPSVQWLVYVQEERDGKLRIKVENVDCWIDKASFVLVRDAPTYFNRRVEANPKDSWALQMRGICYLEKGDADRALRELDESIRLDPKDPYALENRGSIWALKNFDNALRDYDEVIRLDPKIALAYFNRAVILFNRDDVGKALLDFHDASRLDPKLAPAFYGKACCYAVDRQTERAIDNLRQSLELGYCDFDWISRDANLNSIRNDPAFERLMKEFAK